MSTLGEILAAYEHDEDEFVVEVVFDNGENHYIPLGMLAEMVLLGVGESIQCLDCLSGDVLTITCTKEESIDESEEYHVNTTPFN